MIRSTTITSTMLFVVSMCVGQPWAGAQGTTTAKNAQDDKALRHGVQYWTPERARAARPIQWYEAEEDAPGKRHHVKEPTGPAESVEGGRPTERRKSFTEPGDATPLPSVDTTDTTAPFPAEDEDFDIDFGTADIGDNDYVNRSTALWKRYPYTAIGKLFSSGGSCTASVISPNNIIVTAAHCCYNRGTGSWNGSFAFVPAMRRDTRPFGTFPYTQARVLTDWITAGGRQNDVCVLSLGPNEHGQTVSAVTGWLGRSWNWPSVQHHFAFGYPSNISAGLYKYECSAESYANCGDGSVNAMGCNMTFGSSGGPWVRVFKRFSSGALNYVNSVVSGYDACTGTFGSSFNGARFTTSNIVPLCTAQGC